MSLRKQIKYSRKCQRQNLRLFKRLKRAYFEGDEKDYMRVIACVTTQYKAEQEKEDVLRGRN